MTYIPDCRSDENYNENNLKSEDKHFIHGFDWCVEMVIDNFFENLEGDELDSFLVHILKGKVPEELEEEYEMNFTYTPKDAPNTETRKVETYADWLKMKLLDYCESERDSVIVSMIDEDTELDADEIRAIMEEEKE